MVRKGTILEIPSRPPVQRSSLVPGQEPGKRAHQVLGAAEVRTLGQSRIARRVERRAAQQSIETGDVTGRQRPYFPHERNGAISFRDDAEVDESLYRSVILVSIPG